MLLKEDIYSNEVRNFIRFSKKTEKLEVLVRIKYLRDYLQKNGFRILGSPGVFRTAYISPKNEIIKIANFIKSKDDRFKEQPSAPEQNKLEIEKYNQPYSDIFPNVEAYDEKDYLWYIVEKLTPLADNVRAIPRMFPKFVELFKQMDDYTLAYSGADLWAYMRVYLQYVTRLDNRTLDDNIKDEFMRRALPWTIRAEDPNHKQYLEMAFEYLRQPDPNFVKLRMAIKNFNLSPDDFHLNNIGFGSNLDIKIIDAGWLGVEHWDIHNKTTVQEITKKFKKLITEDIYSREMREFLRFARKVEDKPLLVKLKLLKRYLRDSDFEYYDGGAFRTAFKTPKGEMIKFISFAGPRSSWGEAAKMNKLEIKKFNRPDIEAFPRVEEADKNGIWFVVEKVNTFEPGAAEPILAELFPNLHKIANRLLDPKQGGTTMSLLAIAMNFVDKNPMGRGFKIHTIEPGNYEELKTYLLRHMNKEFVFKNFGPEQNNQNVGTIIHYINNGDLNWKRLKKAIQDANVHASDLRLNNLGYTDDGVIKIIDAGF